MNEPQPNFTDPAQALAQAVGNILHNWANLQAVVDSLRMQNACLAWLLAELKQTIEQPSTSP